MREESYVAGGDAISSRPASGSVCDIAPTSESDDWDWFAPVAWKVLGTKDAGAILAEITKYPISTCRAYVAKDRSGRRAPTSHFLRRLMRTPLGRPFALAFMADCEWFSEFQHAAFIGERVLELTKRE